MQRFRAANSGIVDQEINSPPARHRELDRALGCVVMSQIYRQRCYTIRSVDGGCELLELCLIATYAEDRESRTREFHCGAKSDAAACSRDDRYLHRYQPVFAFATRSLAASRPPAIAMSSWARLRNKCGSASSLKPMPP